MEATPERALLLGDMDPETFRRSALRIVDWIEDYASSPEDFPVLSRVAPGEVTTALPIVLPSAANRSRRFSTISSRSSSPP